MPADRTEERFGDILPKLLLEQGLSLRELSRRLGMDPTYLSRVRRGHKRLPPDLPKRVAVSLGLPEDYFPETREAVILGAMRQDAKLREELYGMVLKARRRLPRKRR